MRRADFPYLNAHPEVAYLDSAATCLIPEQVSSAVSGHLAHSHGPVGRSLNPLGELATSTYEQARTRTKHFFRATPEDEVVFTASATDSLNLVAFGLASHLKPGDEVVVDEGLHHSALLPWQAVCAQTGASLTLVPAPAGEEIRGDRAEQIAAHLTPATRAVVIGLVNNVTGQWCSPAPLAGEGRWLIVDASQAIAHVPLALPELQADFVVASTHKAYGLTGLGLLMGPRASLELLQPLRLGGGMVASMTENTWKPLPERLEAGSPNLDGAAAWSAALAYLESIRMSAVCEHAQILTKALCEALSAIPEVTVVGSPDLRSGLVSFTVAGWHPHDVADLLGRQGVFVRAGLHCAGPLHASLGLAGTVRASVGVYTSESDIDRLVNALHALPR